jgi:hypothetical protein
MYLDWIQGIGAIFIIICLLYAIYLLVQPQLVPEGFAVVQTPNQQYAIPELKGATARYVRLRPSLDPKADGYLTVSQLQVIDVNGDNVALKKPVTATSVGGSPIDKKYGAEVLVGEVYLFEPGVSNRPESIVDGVLTPRDALTNVFETGKQNLCSGTSYNCKTPVTTDTEYIEIDLGTNTLISSVIYTGRDDAQTRTIETIDGDTEYLTQIDRIKGMRLEFYNEQRTLTYSSIFPTTDEVQTITVESMLYGVNLTRGSGSGSASGSMLPMTEVSIPNLASFNTFIAPFRTNTQAPTRVGDAGKSPLALAYTPMISALQKIYSSVDIDLSNNIFVPVLLDSPINFYYDLYKQSGCNPVFIQRADGTTSRIIPTESVSVCNPVPNGAGGITVPTTCAASAQTTYTPAAYCNPKGVTPPSITETLPVHIFGTASQEAIREMNQSIEYCKLLYLGSPPAIENFIRVNFSFSDVTAMKAYLRTNITSTIPPTAAHFCVPDIVQRFANGSFITSFSANNNGWNATHCTTEVTPTVLGLIPFVSRNFIVQWVKNRVIRYKRFINMISTNAAQALADLEKAQADYQKSLREIMDAANPANFTPAEVGVTSASAGLATLITGLVATGVLVSVGVGLTAAAVMFNPVTIVGSIISVKTAIASEKSKNVKKALDGMKDTYNRIAEVKNRSNGLYVEETAIPLEIPKYISINSKTVIDSIAQQFYELLGGQFNMSYIYDILPLGSTMLDMRFDLYIHDSVSSISGPMNDLKAQYKRIRSATEVTKDILDQAANDYQRKLSSLEEKSIKSLSSPFKGAVARLFYKKTGAAIEITGMIFDDRAVTSFIPELNGGIPVALGPSPGNVNYSPVVRFTKNEIEPLDCKHPDTLRRIFDDYISLVSDPKNKYPLSKASPPLDVTKGILFVTSVLGASQLSPTSCSLTWTESLYSAATNLPISSGSRGSAGSSSELRRSATFVYTPDTKSWYSSELTIAMKDITFLPSATGITALTPPILFSKPLPARSNLTNLSNICPTTSCEDADVLYTLVEQYNSDPVLPGTILGVTHAFTPNPNQCDVKVSINYDSMIPTFVGVDSIEPTTGVTTTTYPKVKKGAVTYEKVEGKIVEGSKSMPYTGIQKDITIAMYVSVDPATCGYMLVDASGQNSGTSIQSNTPALFTPMMYTKELGKRTSSTLGSSIKGLQSDYTKITGSTKEVLRSYRIQGHAALSKIYEAKGLTGGCGSKQCSDPTIVQKLKDYYKNVIANNGIEMKTITNSAQTEANVCEVTFNTNSSSTLYAYKFVFSSSSCDITGATRILITGPTDDQILDITKEMNAGIREPFVSGRPVQSEAIGVRGFGLDAIRNSDLSLKDTQFELPLMQREPERKPRHTPPSYRFLRFTPVATRGSSTVNVGKFTFYYEEQPLLLKGSVTNPMGTWEGSIADVTGPGPRPGWSDAHKKPLVFAFRDPIAVDAYSFATALPEMGIEGDPISWTLEGSQNGTFWTIVDTQKDYPTPVRRFTDLEKLFLTAGA